MALEELGFKVDQLSFQLDERKEKHELAIKDVKNDVLALRAKVRDRLLHLGQPRQWTPAQSTFVRRVEWSIPNVAQGVLTKQKNDPIYSDAFHVMGVEMKLEFFPKGRDSTWLPGFCAVFLWCASGAKVTYQLRVGNHTAAPDTDEYATRMGHGHSNFCFLESQVDVATDSLIVGVDILDVAVSEDIGEGLRLVNLGPEAIVRRRVAVLTNRDFQRVEWRIRNVMDRAREIPRGSSMWSPTFSLAGVPDMCLEFYPNGIQSVEGDDDADKTGYCGFYLRCPSGCSLTVTLFVGSAKKGPSKADFGSDAAKGMPAFCKLDEQVPDGEKDLVVGVSIENPHFYNPIEELVLGELVVPPASTVAITETPGLILSDVPAS